MGIGQELGKNKAVDFIFEKYSNEQVKDLILKEYDKNNLSRNKEKFLNTINRISIVERPKLNKKDERENKRKLRQKRIQRNKEKQKKREEERKKKTNRGRKDTEKKKKERKFIGETSNNSNINQNNSTKTWAIILSTIAILLIILIAVGGIDNHNNEYGLTDEMEYQNSASGVHLTIHNGDWGDTFNKGDPIMVVMKDTTYWEAMEGCLVSVTLKNKETGAEYYRDCIIGEDCYGYIDTGELPLGEYELYASYYGDYNHYANYYDDIEIVD